MRRKKSCRSHGERLIREFLTEMGLSFLSEYKFDQCRNLKGNLLRFDFYIPSFNLLIEYQGIHHYKPANKSLRAKRITETTKSHDYIKVRFTSENNIKLLCIPYWEQQNIKDIIMNEVQRGNSLGSELL